MRTLIKILALTLIALFIQHGIFLYVEEVFLNTNSPINIEKVEESEETDNDKAETIMLETGIKKVAVSDNGRYVSYIKNNKLMVLDSYDNIEKEVEVENKGEIIYYEWITNANNMIIVQKVDDRKGAYFEPIAYDAKQGQNHSLTDFDRTKVKINLKDENDKIEEVFFSAFSNTLYIKVKRANGKSDLFYLDIMSNLKAVRENKDIGNIVVPPTTTKCVMEMGDAITVLDSPDNVEVPNENVNKILGTDMKDNIYLGEQVNDKITKIHYGVINDSNIKWATLTLSQPVKKEDIHVDISGRIFVNDAENKIVSEITTGNSIKYEGEFVQVYSKGIISKIENKLIKNEIKDNSLIKK